MDMRFESGKDHVTRGLRYDEPLVVPCDGVAVCLVTADRPSALRVRNLSPVEKATFVVISDSECDGTYTLPNRSPGNQWICTTNFNKAKLTVTNLSPGAASIEIVLLDMTGEY